MSGDPCEAIPNFFKSASAWVNYQAPLCSCKTTKHLFIYLHQWVMWEPVLPTKPSKLWCLGSHSGIRCWRSLGRAGGGGLFTKTNMFLVAVKTSHSHEHLPMPHLLLVQHMTARWTSTGDEKTTRKAGHSASTLEGIASVSVTNTSTQSHEEQAGKKFSFVSRI